MALFLNIYPFTVASVLLILFELLVCYTLWIDHGEDYIMPSISDTWALPPGTFISRLIAAPFGFLLLILSITIYCRCRQVTAPELPTYRRSAANVAIILLVVGTFFFSWVPSICNNYGDQCRGCPPLHDLIAVIFFACINIAVILLYIFFYFTESTLEFMGIGLLFTGSAICKVRFLPGFLKILPEAWSRALVGNMPLSSEVIDPLFGIVEWSDVIIMLLLMALYVRKYHAGYSVGIGEISVLEETKTVCFGFKTSLLGVGAATVVFLEVVSTLPANLHQGHYNTTQGVPTISQLQVYPSSNWTTHWTFLFAALFFSIVHVCIYYYQTKHAGSSVINKGLTGIAVIAFVGLAIAGCVGPEEFHTLHKAGFTMFYVFYNIYMLYTICSPLALTPESSRVLFGLMSLSALSCSLAKIRFMSLNPSGLWMNWDPTLGWVDFGLIIVFIVSYIKQLGVNLNNFQVCIVYTPAVIPTDAKKSWKSNNY